MRKLILSSLFLFFSFTFAGQEIGMAPETVYQLKITEEEPVLFIDVRDPVEIMFVGGTDMVDLNIPYMLVDRDSWNEERGTFELHLNPNFTTEVAQALADRNLPKDTLIVTMCRSGSERGKPSADALREAGFTNAHYVVNGFQGDAIKTGDDKGFRTQNGWQNSALPWTPKVDGNKVYRGAETKKAVDNNSHEKSDTKSVEVSDTTDTKTPSKNITTQKSPSVTTSNDDKTDINKEDASKSSTDPNGKKADIQKPNEELNQVNEDKGQAVEKESTASKDTKVITNQKQSSKMDDSEDNVKSTSATISDDKEETPQENINTDKEEDSKKLPSISNKEKEASDAVKL